MFSVNVIIKSGNAPFALKNVFCGPIASTVMVYLQKAL